MSNDFFKLSVPEMNKRSKQIRDQISADIKLDQSDLLQLLLNTAEFELNLKELIRNVGIKSTI